MKEHKVLLAFILSTYWMRNALEEDWQGSPFAGWADKQEVVPAARERLSGQVKCCNQAEIVMKMTRQGRVARPCDHSLESTCGHVGLPPSRTRPRQGSGEVLDTNLPYNPSQ